MEQVSRVCVGNGAKIKHRKYSFSYIYIDESLDKKLDVLVSSASPLQRHGVALSHPLSHISKINTDFMGFV